MPLETNKLLWDMRTAARHVADFARGRTEENNSADVMLRSAVERQFEIPGEALSQLRKLDPATAAPITDSTRIIGFRNQLIHGYAVIDHSITWRIVHEHLPTLARELDALLASWAPRTKYHFELRQ
jgi:uncharacterized protein with HEPN domain